MDDPFAALDALTHAGRTATAVRRHPFHGGVHAPLIAEAIKRGNRILLLQPHPGRV